MENSILMHKDHGLNISMSTCYFCGEAKDLLLFGAKAPKELADDTGKMPMQIGVVDDEPCPTCRKHMELGVMLIGVRNGETTQNPFRTGKIVVIKKEAYLLFATKGAEEARMCFVDEDTWQRLGLNVGFEKEEYDKKHSDS